MTTVLMVSTANAPLAVVTDLNADDTGNNLAKLVDITMNDKAYMLGYCWRASGQNIPETGGKFPISGQIHAFQNINALEDPEASLKFSPSGFVNQPAIVYDQFGPAPLFSVPDSFAARLDQGGAVAADLAALFAAFAYPLPSNAIVAIVTAGAAWTIGEANAAPTYALSRVTDTIEVHTYPTEAIGQNNFYLQPTSDSPTDYQYHLRRVTLDNTTPFDMAQSKSWGLFTLPFNDDLVVHPQGYVVAISDTLSRMMILKLPDAPAPDPDAVAAVIVSGPAGNHGRQGLMNGPTALSVTADGRILVLEQGTSTVPGRIQAFDVNGNPAPSFDGAAVTTLAKSFAADLDAGLVSVALRDTFAAAETPLSGVWRIQDATALYQLVDVGGAIVVTSGGAGLSLSWTVTSGAGGADPDRYDLQLSGSSIVENDPGRRRCSHSGRRHGRARQRERPDGPAWSETLACADAPCTGTGRSRAWPAAAGRRSASGRREAVADDERAREVRPRHSSWEADEQGGAIRCGAGGAKGGGRGKCGPAKHAPGAGPGKRVTGVGPHTASRKAKEGGEVHGALPPSHRRPARNRLCRMRRGRRCGRRWSDMDGVRGEPRGQPRGPARPAPPRSVPGAAEPAGVHPETGRTTAPARGRRSRRQDRPESDSRGAERASHEEDFLGFSYVFRPGRGAHDALDALAVGIAGKKVNFILDADIRAFLESAS